MNNRIPIEFGEVKISFDQVYPLTDLCIPIPWSHQNNVSDPKVDSRCFSLNLVGMSQSFPHLVNN